MKNSAEFTIVYDGPALETHTMDVRELAPAMLAIGDLLDEANAVLYKGKAKVKVNVKAGFKAGSFGVEFLLDQNFISQITDLFNSDGVNAAINIITILGFTSGGGVGVIKLLKWIGKRKITSVTVLESGNVRIEVGKDSVEVSKPVLDLLQNVRIRKPLEEIISKPLARDGVEEFRSYRGDQTDSAVSISKSEGELFTSPTIEEEKLGEDDFIRNLQLISVNFIEGNKWKFSDGNATFFAVVTDPNFIRRVQHNEEAFAKDDILKARIKETQWNTATGLKTEYEILEIVDHLQPKLQIKLPFQTDSDTE